MTQFTSGDPHHELRSRKESGGALSGTHRWLQGLFNRIRPAKYTVDGSWEERIGYFSLLVA